MLGTVALARLAPTRGFVAAVLVLVAVDAALMPTTSWYLKDAPWLRMLGSPATASRMVEREFLPERPLLARTVARDPAACVLLADTKPPFVGTGRGQAFSVHLTCSLAASSLSRWDRWTNTSAACSTKPSSGRCISPSNTSRRGEMGWRENRNGPKWSAVVDMPGDCVEPGAAERCGTRVAVW